MKRSYVLAIALAFLMLGVMLAHLPIRHADAQSGQVGRYQLFQGRYQYNGTDMNGVFRIDTTTGKTDGYYSGKGKDGSFTETWLPIQQ